MELLELGESAEVDHSLVGDAIPAFVSNKLPKSRRMSLLSSAMNCSDSSPMEHPAELVSIVTQSEFGESGQSTR